MDNISTARKWMGLKTGSGFLSPRDYCSTRDIFQARLDKMRLIMESKNIQPDRLYPLIAAIGEIGNNSFDHNLGKWRDIAGIYFKSDFDKKTIVLADRGQGILSSLRRVNPEIKTDAEALKIAFTQRISGRFPEKRGNGLKFVAKVSREINLDFFLQSGKASARITRHLGLKIDLEQTPLLGVLTIIQY